VIKRFLIKVFSEKVREKQERSVIISEIFRKFLRKFFKEENCLRLMIENIDNINHIDLANQIDNPWERDTILSLVNKSKSINYSIRFKNVDKSKIRKKFINLDETQSSRRHNKKVINLVFAYLIFKVLNTKRDLVNYVFICPDHRPSKEVHHYIQKLSHYFGYSDITRKINIKFFNRRKHNIEKKTPAHKLAGKILKGKRKANLAVNFEELHNAIQKLL